MPKEKRVNRNKNTKSKNETQAKQKHNNNPRAYQNTPRQKTAKISKKAQRKARQHK